MKYMLTVLDTVGIQPYIFGSNKLRENIGASHLVYKATREWAFDVLNEKEMFFGKHNILWNKRNKINPYDPDFHIETQKGRAAEVLYAGGGKTVLLFSGDDKKKHSKLAKDFVYQLSKKLLQDAPGLNLYAAHTEYDWQGEKTLPVVIGDTVKKLGRLKGELAGSRPTLGLSVTAACNSTGLPASGRDDKEKNSGLSNIYSEQVIKKREAANQATERLRQLFPKIPAALWTDELDKIGGKDDDGDNFIAVVHADGNGMGKRIQDWNSQHESDNPRQQIEAMRRFSTAIAQTATNALKTAVTNFHTQLEKEKKSNDIFPFRPIVFGGDDVTIVCAGKWGLAFAQSYLTELEKEKLPDGKSPYACAGISIVKTHYPFARAYEMSESLAHSSKTAVFAISKEKTASAMNWHFTTTGLMGSLDSIREREYTVKEGSLHARPLFLNPKYGWRNWVTFQQSATFFQSSWGESRNKTVALRGALRQGRDAVRQFKTIYQHDLDSLDRMVSINGAENGWVTDNGKSHCVYFDAIEMMDHFELLPSQKEESK